MDKQKKYREIPYNYTSFSDREIILRYFDQETWDVLNELRKKRVTGRSAKLLFEVVGDIFVIDRNPYIFNDFLDNPIKQKRLKTVHNRKLAVIAKGVGDSRVKLILDRVADKSREFFKSFKKEMGRRKEISSALCKIVSKEDLFFTAFHKVFHATDATDWRVEFPEAVIYPPSEDKICKIVKKVSDINMKIVPRGGGTGLTGGAVPVQRQTLVVNTERLSNISEVTIEKSGNIEIPVVEVGAGAVTEIVTKFCKERGYIFATDPTSSWASTIGGNIAENCGGKKAVMWGTAIDNIFSFTIVNSSGEIIEVVRKDHPHRKITEDDQVTFNVFNKNSDGQLLKTITLKGDEIRKKGVGKDITNKALGGIPGIQKEGGDGIITSAKFVLYRPFDFSKTLCLEFYGDNLVNASKAIVAIKEKFKKNNEVFLLALEHFDDKYAQAVNYKNKSARREIPKAVLLIDLESNNEALLNSECLFVEQMVKQYECEGFIAKDSDEKKIFWKDRKNLGAIARHTNAFKLNEDVVIPIESLPEFADFIESLNNEKLTANNLLALNQIKKLIFAIDDKDNFLNERKNRAEKYIKNCILNNLTADFHELFGFFNSYDDIVERLTESLKESRSKKIIIATHMHAGDGNVHVNIPVNSSDYEMMMDADETAERVILKTIELGGVISGEHGIGLTKLKFIDKEILNKYAEYKKEADPENLFNPGKLVTDFKYSTVYTPSLKLLTKETLIFEAADLNKLTNLISDCVRCGKCKPKCNTQYANSNMHYSPRNKILGTSLITEAILYEAQTSRNLTLRNFNMLKEVANHCTMCHNCYSPCPVNIDFGEVTLSIRQMLYDRKGEKLKPLTQMTLYYLKKRGYYINKIFRVALLNFGYFAQRSARLSLKPFNPVLKKFTPVISHILDGKFPKTAGKPTIRDIFKLRKPDTFYAITNTQKKIKSTVMYFPGCGSERMFSDISFATLAVLYESGVRVVMPPDYMCCGYPLIANGQASKAQARVYENSVIFYRMAETVSYMNIENVVITCGTCHEMLSSYSLENIFQDSKIIDVNEFLVKQDILNAEDSDDSIPVLYHEPCHSPLKEIEAKDAIEKLLGKKSITIPNCCGEGGTLALSTPDISTSIRSRKLKNISEITKDKKVTVLTTCPSCVQGLSKNDNQISVNGNSLITAIATKHLGKNWKSDFIKNVKVNKSIEHILL